MRDALINLLGEMFQKLIHLFAFMLHDFFSDAGCFFIGFFEFMIFQFADFFLRLAQSMGFDSS